MNLRLEKTKTNKIKKTDHIPQEIKQIQKKNIFHFILNKGINPNIALRSINSKSVIETELEIKRLQNNALLYSNISRIR